MIDVFMLRGTGEPYNGAGNLLKYVTAKLDGLKFRDCGDVNYPASIGPVNPQSNPQGISEESSILAAQPLIAAAVRQSPNPVLLLGYSLGASCVSRFLADQTNGAWSDCEIVGAGFVANPWRADGERLNPASTVPGYGISGQHRPFPTHVKAFTVANPQDGITACPADSPLRALSVGVDPLTFAELNWATPDFWMRLVALSNKGYTQTQIKTALQLAKGYFLDGQHEAAYVNQGYTDRLAAALNASL